MKGQRFIWGIGAALSRAELPPRDRLQEASRVFWKAMFYEQTWPPALRSDAAALVSRLFYRGPIYRTISLMDEETVGEMLIELRAFVESFTAAASASSAPDPAPSADDPDPQFQFEN